MRYNELCYVHISRVTDAGFFLNPLWFITQFADLCLRKAKLYYIYIKVAADGVHTFI